MDWFWQGGQQCRWPIGEVIPVGEPDVHSDGSFDESQLDQTECGLCAGPTNRGCYTPRFGGVCGPCYYGSESFWQEILQRLGLSTANMARTKQAPTSRSRSPRPGRGPSAEQESVPGVVAATVGEILLEPRVHTEAEDAAEAAPGNSLGTNHLVCQA